MKNSYVLMLVATAAVASNLGCGSTNPDSLAFVRNAQSVEIVFRAFEAEDAEAFWGGFAETAMWRGTGVNAPTTLSREKMRSMYDTFWAEFDYKLMEPPHFLPGVDPETQRPNGSVNGIFLWEVSKTAEDGSRKSVQLWIYESFDFNDDGDIVFTQVFSDVASAYRILGEPETVSDE